MASIDDGSSKSEHGKAKSKVVESEEVSCIECYSLFWKAKIITVEPVTFLYMLGMYFGTAFTYQYYFQRYVRDNLHHSTVHISSHICITEDYLNTTLGENVAEDTVDEAERHATHLTFLSILPSMLVSVVSTILMGPLTDRYGRKFSIASANFGGIVSSVLVVYIVWMELNLYYFIVASVVSSFFGGFGVLLMGTFSYVADISSHKIRSLRIGILEVMVYVSSSLTSVLAGVWLVEVNCDFISLTWAPLTCFFLSLLYTLFFLPESLSVAQRQAKKGSSNKLKLLWKGISLYFQPKLVTLKLWICLGVLLIVIINITGVMIISTYFYIQKPLGWNPEQIGLYGGYNGLTHGLALLLLMPIATAVGVPDIVLAIIGVICSCLSYLFIAGVKQTWQMFVISSFQGIEAVIVPCVRSMMSKYVSKDEQGALFAVIAAVEVSGALIGSSVYSNLYPTLHQQSYFLMSVLAMIPIIPLCLVLIMEIWAKRAKRAKHRLQQKQLCDSASCATNNDERSSLLAN